MGAKTDIAWCDSCWSCLRGCSRTIADGATTSGCGDKQGGCYAERNGWRFAGPGGPYEGLVRMTPNGPRWTGKVLLIDKHLLDPIRWHDPRRIFTTSVSDPFHESLTNETIALLFGVMALTRRHIHQCLTKRIKRAREWFIWISDEAERRDMDPAEVCVELLTEYVESDRFTAGEHKLMKRAVNDALATNDLFEWPLPNVHLGTSVEHQAAAEDRIPLLLSCPAHLRWLSIEPMIGPVDLAQRWCTECTEDGCVHMDWLRPDGVGWVVVGAESGPNCRPAEQAWFDQLRDQCARYGVPFFLKQIVVEGKLRHDVSDFPPGLQIQEFPDE